MTTTKPYSGPVVRTRRVVRAPRERVFKAWIDPADIQRWFGRSEGVDVPKVEVDLRVGGHYLIVMRGAEGEVPLTGTYLEVEEPSRLVYTFRWEREVPLPGSPWTKETRVTVEFRELGEDTEVVLTHEGHPNDEVRDGHMLGWGQSLDNLSDLLEKEIATYGDP